MSELPVGWAETTLRELGTWSGGGTPSKAVAAFWDGDIPWVSPKDMKVERIRDAENHITQEAVQASATQLVPAGAVLVVTRSGILRHTLPVAVTEREVALNQDLKALRPARGILPDYVSWYLRKSASTILHTCSKSGTTVSNIDTGRMLDFTVPLAPLNEQRRIVAAIEEQFSRLDAADRCVEQIGVQLNKLEASILTAAVVGRLVPQHPEDEPASQLLQRTLDARRAGFSGRTYREPASPAGVDLEALPPGWAWATLEQVSKRVTVGHVGPMKHEYLENGVPFVRSQNVRQNFFDRSGLRFITPAFHEKLRKSTILPGDLLVVRSGSVGVSCVAPSWLGEANCSDLVIIQRPLAIVPEFGAYYLNSVAKRAVRSGTVGVALAHFNTRSVAELPIPVPPLEEQTRIVEEVERQLSVVASMREAIDLVKRRSATLRRSILDRAFRGELVRQDPSDEPASVLLEQIRTERAEATPSSPRRRRVSA